MEFTGDLENVNPIQLSFIEGVLRKYGFNEAKITLEIVGQKGDNFIAIVKRVIAESADGKSLRMVAKIAPSLEVARQITNAVILFTNEVTMYKEVLPKFTDLQKSAGISEEELLRYPKCYGALLEAPNEVILLEDLSEHDFEMRDKMTSLTNDEIKLILKSLATLHSLSYVLKSKDPELYESYKQKLINLWMGLNEIEEAKTQFQQIEGFIFQFFDTDIQKSRSAGLVSNLITNSTHYHKLDLSSKYSVIQHGDTWTNNILFKVEEGKTDSCIMIDYQVSRPSSPVMDIFYLIFNCTDLETRSKHYHDWIDYYHKKLDNSLFNYNLKANLLYPREKLDADMKTYGKYAYGLSLLLNSVLLRDSEESIDMKVSSDEELTAQMNSVDSFGLNTLKEETKVRIKKRIQDLFSSFSEYGYL